MGRPGPGPAWRPVPGPAGALAIGRVGLGAGLLSLALYDSIVRVSPP